MLDIAFSSDRSRLCNGQSRRDFLQVGGLGLCGLSLASLLRQEAAAKEDGSGLKKTARAKSVILVYLGGGLTHHDSFDMKPEAPAEIRGKYSPIASNVPGTQVGELLPKMAACMDKVALVRSGAHNNDHHETATNWVLSGRFGSAFGDYPAIGAVAAHELGFAGVLPPYIAVPRNPSFTWELGRSAFLGGRYESFKTGDPNDANFKVRDVSVANVTDKQAERRKTLLGAVDSLADKVRGNDQLATYDEFRGRAAEMILSPAAQAAFAIEKEDVKLRDRYGRSTFGQSCLLARRLVEGGVRFVTVNYGGWDHHGKIFESCDKKLPEFDLGLSALLEDLTARGLLKDTLIACFGEFGRTPLINKDAGRDHWGPAASLLFAGAGVQGGKLIGATDKQGAYVTTRPYAPADVCYTILDSLGVNPHTNLTTPDGRVIEALEEGELMSPLFA